MATALEEVDTTLRLKPDYGAALLLKSEVLVAKFADEADDVSGPIEPRYLYLKQAAESLETFFRLYPNEPDTDNWRQQLYTLRGYDSIGTEPNNPTVVKVFAPSKVSSKARLLVKPAPEYTEYARSMGIQGTVRLRAVLSSDGTVKHILVLNMLGGGLTGQAIKAARGIKFIPATVAGKPVSQYVVIEYNFLAY
ncbi:MAG: energy transducer TonB [Pyrinomonadaceae bacterium]